MIDISQTFSLIDLLNLSQSNGKHSNEQSNQLSFDQLLEKHNPKATQNLLNENFILESAEDGTDASDSAEVYIKNNSGNFALIEHASQYLQDNIITNNTLESVTFQTKIASRLLPFTSYALGKLSYITNTINSNLKTTSESRHPPTPNKLIENSNPNQQERANLQSKAVEYVKITNKVTTVNLQTVKAFNNQLNKIYESQLQLASNFTKLDDYQLRKITFIDIDNKTTIIARDYRLSDQQQEQLAQVLAQQVSESKPKSNQPKLIINGKLYRSYSS